MIAPSYIVLKHTGSIYITSRSRPSRVFRHQHSHRRRTVQKRRLEDKYKCENNVGPTSSISRTGIFILQMLRISSWVSIHINTKKTERILQLEQPLAEIASNIDIVGPTLEHNDHFAYTGSYYIPLQVKI